MADKHRITMSEGLETKVFEVSTEKLASALSDAIATAASKHDVEVLLDSDGVTTSIVIENLGSGDGR